MLCSVIIDVVHVGGADGRRTGMSLVVAHSPASWPRAHNTLPKECSVKCEGRSGVWRSAVSPYSLEQCTVQPTHWWELGWVSVGSRQYDDVLVAAASGDGMWSPMCAAGRETLCGCGCGYFNCLTTAVLFSAWYYRAEQHSHLRQSAETPANEWRLSRPPHSIAHSTR